MHGVEVADVLASTQCAIICVITSFLRVSILVFVQGVDVADVLAAT